MAVYSNIEKDLRIEMNITKRFNHNRPIKAKHSCRQCMRSQSIVGYGGALVESIAFNRRVVGSTPALAAT